MAVAFNKRDCLSLLKPYGIQTAASVYLNKGDKINYKEILKSVGLPCFVKPNRAGSSFGISKVYQENELAAALEKAYSEDDQVLIEAFLDGTEVSVGVISFKNKIIALPITEIVSDNDFFDYEAKYEGKSKEITPARISETERKLVSDTAVKIYSKLQLKGMSRADFIIVKGQPMFIELNMVPGLSPESILPQQAKAAGISLEELFENCLYC